MTTAESRAQARAQFRARFQTALENEPLSEGLLNFQRSWRETREAQLVDLEGILGRDRDQLRHSLAQAKDRVIADQPAQLASFRAAAETAGARVIEVETAEEANAYVAALCERRDVRTVVKGKSMATEETELNEHLARLGIEAVETDLGEWLLQLDGDRPSHVVMPAIHRRRHEIAALLERELGLTFDPDDIEAMVHSARGALRAHFLAAGIGITGANALVAETGSVMLVTNEGNGELTASLPPVHVVFAGIEKLVATTAEAIEVVRLLARSATAQPISTYTSFFTGPAEAAGDGTERELHILILDNGRRQMAADPDFASALRCIKCGACANVCPAYQVVGGHAFGHIYSGPIGLVNTAFHHGLEFSEGPQSLCLSCGACETVCPVEIPLPGQILEIRRRVNTELGVSRRRRQALRLFASRRLVALAFSVLGTVTWPFRHGSFLRPPLRLSPRALRRLTFRTPPAFPTRPARQRRELRAAAPAIAQTEASGRRVILFLQCVADRLVPAVAVATADLLRAAGCEVEIPDQQHCCGLPAIDGGDDAVARRMARQTLEVLGAATEDSLPDIVTPAPSCAIAMLHDYERLFDDEPVWQHRARRLTGRVWDLTAYLAGPARLPDGVLARGDQGPVAVDRFCQGANLLGRGDMLDELVRGLTGSEIVPLDEAEVCCGFGGSTSLVAPELSAGVLARKLENVRASGASVLLTDNPGCLVHLRGGADAAHLPVQVQHVAEYLAARLSDRPDLIRNGR